VSWPRSTGQVPIYYSHNLTQLPETSPTSNRVTGHPQHSSVPFGYGLSYTSFSFSNLTVTPASRVGDPIEVSAE